MSSAASRCASFSRAPSPAARTSGVTPSMCDHCVGRPSLIAGIE